MSDYLATLAERITDPQQSLRPALPSLFEATAEAAAGSLEDSSEAEARPGALARAGEFAPDAQLSAPKAPRDLVMTNSWTGFVTQPSAAMAMPQTGAGVDPLSVVAPIISVDRGTPAPSHADRRAPTHAEMSSPPLVSPRQEDDGATMSPPSANGGARIVLQPEVTPTRRHDTDLHVESRRTSGRPQIVRVTIGRVEVRAVMPQAAGAANAKPARKRATPSLAEYLKSRNEGHP